MEPTRPLLVLLVILGNTVGVVVSAPPAVVLDEADDEGRTIRVGNLSEEGFTAIINATVRLNRGQNDADSEPTVVEGEPKISVFAPNRTVAPGDQREFVVQVVNSGELQTTGPDADPADESRVQTAQNVQVTLESDGSPVEVRSATTGLGDLQSGEAARAPFEIVVPADADAGTYSLSAEVEYEFVDESGGDAADRKTETTTEDVELVVTKDARFEVDSVDADVQVGETDSVEVDMENVGEADVTDAEVQLISQNENLRVDSTNRTVRFVDEWDAGDEEAIAFQVTATNDSVPQNYAIRAVVRYTDEDGTRRRSRPIPFGVTPDDEQTFELDDVEGPLRVGEKRTITGDLSNEGPESATDVVLRIESPAEDIVPLREEFVLEDIDESDDEAFAFPVRVAEPAESGDRQFEFVVQYRDENGDSRASETLPATIAVESERPRFEFAGVTQTLQAGTDGTLNLTLDNQVGEALSETRISVRSPNTDLQIAGDENASRFVGPWDEDENRTVRVTAELAADATAQSYPLVATVAYTDTDGETNRSDPIRFGVMPADEQQFSITNVTSSASASEEGLVRGRLTNVGPRNVTDVLVRLENSSRNVDPREDEFVVGRLDANTSTRFAFPLDIRDDAEPGPRQVTARVDYRDAEGDRQQSDSIPVRLVVGPETDVFAVRPVSATVEVGSTGTVTLDISNNRNVTLRDVNAKVFVTEPLSTDDDQAFVASLGPNESVRLQFDVSATGQARTKTVPLKIDFQYEEPDGDTELSNTYQVGVEVVESEDGFLDGLGPFSVAVMGILVPVAGIYLWRRQG